jgi:hypothetical protein
MRLVYSNYKRFPCGKCPGESSWKECCVAYLTCTSIMDRLQLSSASTFHTIIPFMTPNNFREKANLIRQVADDTLRVRGTFKAHEYGDVILPFVVLRRLDLVLKPKKDDVIKQYEQFKDSLDEERLTPILCQAAGEPTSTTTPSMTCAGWPRIRRISS